MVKIGKQIAGVPLMPSGSAIKHFAVGAIAGFVIDRVVAYLWETYLVPYLQLSNLGIIGIPIQSVILLIAWFFVATKHRALGVGLITGTLVSMISSVAFF